MPNSSHRILDTRTHTEYRSKAAAGRDLASLVNGDPKDQFVWFRIAGAFPQRFRVMNGKGQWVALDDPSAPVGTLRPTDVHARVTSGLTKVTTLVIDVEKYARVSSVLGTTTLRETVDRSFDEVLVRAAREQDVERLHQMEGLDLDKPAIMANAWR